MVVVEEGGFIVKGMEGAVGVVVIVVAECYMAAEKGEERPGQFL